MLRFALPALAVAAATASCQDARCPGESASTAGSVLLQVQSAKSATKAKAIEEMDNDHGLDESDAEIDADFASDEVEDEAENEHKENNADSACPSGGKSIDGKCWHLALPSTSCEETCVEKNLQYDEATDLGKGSEGQDKCLSLASKFGFPGMKKRLMQWTGRGCGCVVYKIPAYGRGDRVRLNHGETNAKCAKTSTISSRLCACKAAAAVGESCESSSGCAHSFCKSGTCSALLAEGDECPEHSACETGFCSPDGKCGTVGWKKKSGAFALSYRKSGARRYKRLKVANWEEMSKFPAGFCLGYYPRTTGCLVARGIDRPKTIAKAQQRCAQSSECKAVWCCATACPATTCWATKAVEPNLKAKDCPSAPGSFHETKYPNSFYVKDIGGGSGEDTVAKPTPPPTPEPSNDEDEESPGKDDKESSFVNLYKGKMCKFGRGKGNRYTRLKGEDTVEECAEAVRQRSGTSFAFLAQKKICLMAPKDFSKCASLRAGKWDLYELVLMDEDTDDELEQDE